MFSPSLPGGPGDMGTVGSGGAVLTGQVAAANIGYRDGRQHVPESERLRKARLRVEKAIKVRGLISHCPRCHMLAFVPLWLRSAEPEDRAGAG